jgi:hypothetical protein
MLIRDNNGKIIIIYRKNCKNEKDYNEKIYHYFSSIKFF